MDGWQWPPDSWFAWLLYGVGALYLSGFVGFFLFFAARQRAALRGGPDEVEAFNRSIRGFPNMLYAKMLGKRRLEWHAVVERQQRAARPGGGAPSGSGGAGNWAQRRAKNRPPRPKTPRFRPGGGAGRGGEG